ncbi:hypothetical protein CMUS01_13015 [Colletotrichum musicola]|uniref:Uncharacterized protein n=1 Tax=Colletotrichum musicola TaxID=2175873 RepID=A0A8H6JGR9_9PEZI|nr:hypothetical protein CMUS01_13015 [Colletotrichum musicola]
MATHRQSSANIHALSDVPRNPFLLIPPALWSTPAQAVRLVNAVLPASSAHAVVQGFYYFLFPGPYASSSISALATFLSGGEDGVGVSLRNRIGVVVFGVFLNHVRRVLCPALGLGGYGGPVGMLKLAKSSPELFLKEEFAGGFPGRSWNLAKGAGLKLLGDFGGELAGGILWGVVRRLQDSRRKDKDCDEEWIRKTERFERKIGCVAVVFVMVWVLGGMEFVHARGAHLAAVGVAYWKMMSGGGEYRRALWRMFVPSGMPDQDAVTLTTFLGGFWRENDNRLGILWFHIELLLWIRHGVYHLLKVAILSALGFDVFMGEWRWWYAGPRPGLALVIGAWVWGTGYVVRYSNKYYIGLEMCDGLLVAWWVAAAGAWGAWRGVKGLWRRWVVFV